MSSTAMSPVTTDVDFAFAPMQPPYLGFFDAGNMPMPSLERPLLGLGHQQHNNHYDDFDCAASFPFQDSSFLLPPTTSLPPAPPLLTMDMAMAPTSPSSMHQMTLPCVPAEELYHPAFGVGSSPFLKREDGPVVDAGGGKIGLNLGRRTYFSTADVLAVDRLLLTRSPLGGGGGVGAGLGLGLGMAGVLGLGLRAPHHHQQPPRCQAEGCKADLTAAKHYHRRHKVCEYHAKAAAVAAGGKQQRFCQQCSRFHVLVEFDESKRSCRKRLTEHNRRRRKPASEQGDKEDSSPPPKRADTTSYSSDHKSASPAAAKSTAISPNGSGVSCLDMDNNGQMMISSAAAAAPTARSLSALPLGKDGDLDTMLMMRQVHDGDEEQQRFVTSLVLQAQQHHHNGGVGNVLSTLSCSPVPDQHQNGDCNGFFEVDFI